MPEPVSATSQRAELSRRVDAHVDAAAGRGVLDGVVDQDQQHLLDTVRIGLDRGVDIGADSGELDLGRLRQRRGATNHVRGDFAELDRRGHQLQLAASERASVEQVRRQALHARDLGAHVVEQLAVGVERLVAPLIEQVGRRAEHGQRRAQLVRRVGDELLLALERRPGSAPARGPTETRRRQTTAASPSPPPPSKHQQQRVQRGLLGLQALADDQQAAVGRAARDDAGWLAVDLNGVERRKALLGRRELDAVDVHLLRVQDLAVGSQADVEDAAAVALAGCAIAGLGRGRRAAAETAAAAPVRCG